MADLRQWPPRPLLPPDHRRQTPAHRRNRRLAARLRRHRWHPQPPDGRMIADLLHRLRALVLPGRWSRELDDEMRFHMEQDTAARIRAGADPATARREAR